ncbi:MAG TPA: hypothetical protein VFN67_41435 [Polyangiales bacterium]|jgi:hypothetical protein|nr:hypothetical protein [Polyangiales bacterium]
MTGLSTAGLPDTAQVIAGRYHVDCVLGRGGMGCVYAVVDTTSGRKLALKQLTSEANATVRALCAYLRTTWQAK